jgi:hypothetical protein
MGRKWIYKPSHPKANERGFVAWEDYGGSEARAVDAPILMDRFYENTKATDGTDIGSRRKHREYMKATGLAPTGDFSPQFYENQKKSERLADAKDRRETLAKATWEVFEGRK